MSTVRRKKVISLGTSTNIFYDMNEILQTLQNLGIEEKQANVYLACLELGTATIQEVSDKSGIKRTSIYNFLDEMKQNGLVAEIRQDGKTFLIAEDPNALIQKTKKQFELAQSALPDLMSIYNLPGNKPKVRFYTGIEGIKKVYMDVILKSGEKIYGFSDYEKMFEVITDESWLWSFPESRKKKNMTFYSIAKDGVRGRDVKSKDTLQLRETKLVSGVEFDTEINIFGNKVAMMSFRRPYAAVVIEDRAIATTMKSTWQLLWNMLPAL